MSATIRMQSRTPVAVKIMSVGRKRRVLLTAKGRLAFPDVTMEYLRAERAYAALGGGSSRSCVVLDTYRRVCAEGNVSRDLPKPLFLAAMDGFAVKVLRAVARAEAADKPLSSVNKSHRIYLTAHCRRALSACFVRCHYPNYQYDQVVADYGRAGWRDDVGRIPRFCSVTPTCRGGFGRVRGSTKPYYGGRFGTVSGIPIDWSWYRDIYLKGLAVVENHLILRYLGADSDTLHRVTVLVQTAGPSNIFHEEERLVWQTGEGMLLLRP